MQIDWLTVAAQWINFLILMWLLRRFLYQPIVQAMDKRQQAISARMEDADQKTQQAEQTAEDYRNKLAEMEIQRAALLTAAREAAETERERLLKQARDEYETLSMQWQRDIEREKLDFQNQLSHEFGRLITTTARQAVQDLTSLELEQALFANFLTRLQNLSGQEKRLLTESGLENIVFASSAELNETWRTRFVEGLNTALNCDLPITFKPLPNSQLGIMLITPTYTIEWCVEHYFEALQTELNTALTPQKNRQPC